MNNTRFRVRTTNGRWTKTQNDRFMKGLERYGRDWVCVQKVVKTRTLTQVRSHAQKVFLKLSQNEIQELVPQVSQSQEPKNQSKLQDGIEEQCKGQNLQVFSQKQSIKIEGNLLELFMHAIQQQSREPSCHQDNTTVIQQYETKLETKWQPLQKTNVLIRESQKENENPQRKGQQRKKEFQILDQPQININRIYPIYVNLKETSINKN